MQGIKGLIVVVLAALLGAAEYRLVSDRRAELAWPTVVATVSGHDVVTSTERVKRRTRTSTTRYAEVAYRLPSPDGRPMPVLQATLSGGNAPPIGAEVQLKVDPEHPDDVAEYSLFGIWIVPVAVATFGAALLFMAAHVLWPSKGPARERARAAAVRLRASPRLQRIVQISLIGVILVALVFMRSLGLMLFGGLFLLITVALVSGSLGRGARRLVGVVSVLPDDARPGPIGLLVDLVESVTLATIAMAFLGGSLLAIAKGYDHLRDGNVWGSASLNRLRTLLWLPQDFDRALCDATDARDLTAARWLAANGARAAVVCAAGPPPLSPAIAFDDPAFPRGESVLTALLVQALRDERLADARRFLAQGASAKAIIDGRPALLYATWNKLDDAVTALLEHGADPNATAGTGTILSEMAILDQRDRGRDYLRQMVAHGGDLDRPLADGKPLLLQLCREPGVDDAETIVLLLDLGARTDAADADGRTCADYLAAIGLDDALAAVRAHGGRSGRLASGTAITAASDAGQAALAQIQSMLGKEPAAWSPSFETLRLSELTAGLVANVLPRGTPTIAGFQQGDRASAQVCDAFEPRMCIALELRRDPTAKNGWRTLSLWRAPA
jgi:hypothetical protein